MAPAAPEPARAAKRLETVRAASNPAGVRKVVRLLGAQADAVVRGSDDLCTTARIIARVTAAMPKEALVTNGIVPVAAQDRQGRATQAGAGPDQVPARQGANIPGRRQRRRQGGLPLRL